jgi:hypothetical protein
VSGADPEKVRELLTAVIEAEGFLQAGDRDRAGAVLVRVLERFGQACLKHDTRGPRCPDCNADEDEASVHGRELEDNGDGSRREGWSS